MKEILTVRFNGIFSRSRFLNYFDVVRRNPR
jgi:hypothetical protein